MATSNKFTAGDLFTFSVTPKDATGAFFDLTVGTWVCEIGVYKNGAELLRKTVTALNLDNSAWTAYLDKDETRTLGAGTFVLVAQVHRTDVTPQIAMEMQDKITISAELLI